MPKSTEELNTTPLEKTVLRLYEMHLDSRLATDDTFQEFTELVARLRPLLVINIATTAEKIEAEVFEPSSAARLRAKRGLLELISSPIQNDNPALIRLSSEIRDKIFSSCIIRWGGFSK